MPRGAAITGSDAGAGRLVYRAGLDAAAARLFFLAARRGAVYPKAYGNRRGNPGAPAGRDGAGPHRGRRLEPARARLARGGDRGGGADRKSTRLNSMHVEISYAVFCLKKK